MSKPTFIKILLWMGVVVLTGAVGAVVLMRSGDDLSVPKNRSELLHRAIWVNGGQYHIGSRETGCHPDRIALLASYYMWPFEVSREWWAIYQGNTTNRKLSVHPAASVSYDEAQRFCEWLSERYQVRARLPTIDEWEVAARAGTPGVPYPWGWHQPAERAVFNTMSAAPVASGSDANPWGFFDMAGNVAEWCRADEKDQRAFVMGGSWAERDPRFLRISHRLDLPKHYQDEDVGFRFVIEPDRDRQK